MAVSGITQVVSATLLLQYSFSTNLSVQQQLSRCVASGDTAWSFSETRVYQLNISNVLLIHLSSPNFVIPSVPGVVILHSPRRAGLISSWRGCIATTTLLSATTSMTQCRL